MADVFLSYPLSFFISLLLSTNVLIHSKSSVLASTNNSVVQIGEDSLPAADVTGGKSHLLNENVLGPTDNIPDKVRKNLFVLTQVSKSECFVGEPIIVTYKLYSRLNAKSSIVSQPLLTGFSKHDLNQVTSLIGSSERIGGKIYQVYILRKTQLVPIISGKLALDPIELEHTINFIRYDEDSVTAGTQLTDFIQQKKTEEQASHKEVTIRTSSSSVNLSVKDLPEENKPANFSGAIGSFSIQAKITGKPIEGGTGILIVEIKGKGNLVMTDPPNVQFPAGIEPSHLPPSIVSDNMGPDFKTSRQYEYPVVFRQAGHVQIPSVSFSYFEPGKQIYKTIHTMSTLVQVQANPEKDSLTAAGTPKPYRVTRVPSATVPSSYVFIFWILSIGAAVLAAITARWSFLRTKRLKHQTLKSDGKPTAYSRAEDRLKKIKEMLDKSDFSDYYRELNASLWDVITDKITLLPTDLNKGNVFAKLNAYGWTPEELWELELTMNEYERNLYVPGYQDENDYESSYNKALRIMAKLEQIHVSKQEQGLLN